ncbi:uncharacterized protein EAE97_002812 [Botrytis byssoidea]|uniref:Uncharacterized protein n=1 Tax=Botrytis byssoidea TaxID=139641 RepID=A0A9P5IRX6_9HELO|nr:uncharacterized protein EAE97_002812 [Botrytis byssoidea]KAF7949303.1 hypothetical protein EAE97_002812 [Botrytis byssoidea]
MANIIMQDTVIHDTLMQDTVMQDTTTQDTVVLALVRKITRMKRLKKNGVKVASEVPPVREDSCWEPTEISYLLHLYTINENNISRTEKGAIYYGKGVAATLVRDMTAESVKHSPGGSLHASDPWYPRNYTLPLIVAKIRCLIHEEDDLAVELEAELNAHYGNVPDPVAKQPSRFAVERRRRALAKELKQKQKQKQKPELIIVEEALREAERVLGEELVQNANQTLRLEFKKVKKPVITDKTDA